ncbi:hypothetical protein ACK1FJ_004604 [Salmonella enterica]
MKISYPIRDIDGKEFRSLDDIMRLVDAETHGTWLLGGNGLWHGAIHISDVSNRFSSLNPDVLNTGEPVPLQFMADGTIAAYRINNDYLTGPCKGKQLRYSSTFVLVKSLCQPDPQKEKSWLEFYSLYMHLAPVKDYPVSPCYKVRDGHKGILLRTYTDGVNGLPDGQESGDIVVYQAPPKTSKSLKAGDRFVSSRTGRFYVITNGEPVLTTFGLVRLLNGETTGQTQYWVTLDEGLMEPDGEIQALMPAWMQKAKEKGIFDVVQPGGETEEWRVSAGTPVGFMGCEEYPGRESGQAEREWFVHLEVLSTDQRMPSFLSNPEGVKGEKRTVVAPKGKILYTRQTTAGQETFTATPVTLGAQCVLPREAATPVRDGARQWWYNITGNGWLPEGDVLEAGQYDLLKLGFQPLAENSSGDVMYSPYESWVPEAFGSVSRAAEQGDEWYDQVPPFYRELMAEMDSNRDGNVTEEEIRQALVVRDPLVRNVVNRLVVKHRSEWYGGRTTGRWEGFYQDLDTEEVAYCEKWQTDLEWMSEVSPFSNNEPVWHFHPVLFINTLAVTGTGCAKLLWGKKVDEIHGPEKGCIFRKKVVSICSELWGDSKKFEYADVLMVCMAVETSRKFMSSVTEFRNVRNSNGEIVYVTDRTGRRRPRVEEHVYTTDEIRADPSITQRKPVGLIQFTEPAVEQINLVNNLSITKQQLALMDVIEQLDYVKLYFLSLGDTFKSILTPEDLYVFIFCPRGVGQPDDAVLYSRDSNRDDYNNNSSLDSNIHGNTGNNDGLIQKRELLSRLERLKKEGQIYRNNCVCLEQSDDKTGVDPKWMPFAWKEYSQYKGLLEADPSLDSRIKIYHNTTNVAGAAHETPWCGSFVNWCLNQAGYFNSDHSPAAAAAWGRGRWPEGEVVDKPFYGAVALMNYPHVTFVCGVNRQGSLLLLGGNQGGRGVTNLQGITISRASMSQVVSFMKPKGYEVPEEHYNLQLIDIDAIEMNYENTH